MLSYIGIAFYVIASQHENLKLFMTVLNSNTKQKTSFLSCKICQNVLIFELMKWCWMACKISNVECKENISGENKHSFWS